MAKTRVHLVAVMTDDELEYYHDKKSNLKGNWTNSAIILAGLEYISEMNKNGISNKFGGNE